MDTRSRGAALDDAGKRARRTAMATTSENAASVAIVDAHVAAGVLTSAQGALIRALIALDQSHLVRAWPAPGVDDDAKRAFAEQLSVADAGYPGGVAKYIANARGLLAASRDGKNPFEGWTPSVPAGKVVKYGGQEHVELERVGVEEARATAFVLVAGGLGERLGYSGIKVELPVEQASETKYLELYVKNILALQNREASGDGVSVGCCGAKSTAGAEVKSQMIPLAIMTSDDTHEKTLSLLEKNDYFGASKEQVTLIKQEKVPCLIDNDAHLALKDDDQYKLQLKPHGHGDVHSLLHTSGLLSKWMSQGKKWVVFFQDTNSLVFRVIPGALGVSKSMNLEFNSLCVPRKAKEAVGAISLLTHTDGRKMTINVEYNQLDPLLRATTNPDGDVNDATGFSPFPGNINQLIVSLPEYAKQLKKTGGAIEEFVNPKYKDSTKTTFKSPTRLECMMQDYPKSLGTKAKVGFTVFDNWVGYSPVKNSPADGLAKFKNGDPTHTATSGEFEFYECCAEMLRLAGADIPAATIDQEFNGMKLPMGPRVVIGPNFASTFEELKAKIGKLKMTATSTLIIDGADVSIKNLDLDGTLIVDAVKGHSVVIDGVVKNKGWNWKSIGGGFGSRKIREIDALRGFTVEKKPENEARFVFEQPGSSKVPSAK
jgi:UDP-sugar pyrophosphorylase